MTESGDSFATPKILARFLLWNFSVVSTVHGAYQSGNQQFSNQFNEYLKKQKKDNKKEKSKQNSGKI